MRSDILSKEAKTGSPCLECPHRDTGGNSCALLCLRLAAFNSGKDWEEEPLPYIAKRKTGKKEMVKIMGETEDQESEAKALEEKPEKAKDVCVICHDKDKKILNLRSKTCGACYQAWNIGKIDHPTLGKFKPSLTKSKIKTTTIQIKNLSAKATRPGKLASRSYPFPDIVTLDFSKYLEIKAVVFERVDKFLLPAEHIVMSMLAGALAGKKED